MLALPALGTITSYSLADNVGRIRLDNGTELRVGGSALRNVVPAAGSRVRVTKVEPHRLGGLRAVEVLPETNASPEEQQRAVLAYAEAQGTGPQVDRSAMAWVKPDPLSPDQQAWIDSIAADRAARDQEEHDRAERARIATDLARKHRAELGPAAAWGPILREAGVPPKLALAAQGAGRPAASFLLGSEPARDVCSRVGGAPDVAPQFQWPRYEEEPLAFLAQLRLAELPAAVRTDLRLPADGVLAFFYAVSEQPWGYEPDHRGGARVFYFANASALRRATVPEELEDEPIPERRVTFVEELSLPSPGSPTGERLFDSDDDVLDAYVNALAVDLASRGNVAHKVGGFADEIQDAMEVECAGVTRGISFGDGTAQVSDETRTQAAQWRLLLQLDTDDSLGVMWGDSGRIYFWMREEDLRSRAFDRAWCILQCY